MQHRPRGGDVAGPGPGVALDPGPARPGQQPRAPVRAMPLQRLVTGLGHAQPVEVAALDVIAAPTLEVVAGLQRQRGIDAGGEDRWLAHVVPDAGHALVEQLRVLVGPPLGGRPGWRSPGSRRGPARPWRWPREPSARVRKYPLSWPSTVEREVVGLGHARVDDGHALDPRGLEVGEQAGQIRERLLVHGEDPVAVHVVDVEVDGRQRQVVRLEPGQHRPDVGLGLVAPATLVVAERPPGRECRPGPSGGCSARGPRPGFPAAT